MAMHSYRMYGCSLTVFTGKIFECKHLACLATALQQSCVLRRSYKMIKKHVESLFFIIVPVVHSVISYGSLAVLHIVNTVRLLHKTQ